MVVGPHQIVVAVENVNEHLVALLDRWWTRGDFECVRDLYGTAERRRVVAQRQRRRCERWIGWSLPATGGQAQGGRDEDASRNHSHSSDTHRRRPLLYGGACRQR